MKQRQPQSRRGGFTLIEAAVATVIIALGVTALMLAVSSATRTTAVGKEMTQAVFLAQELREWTVKLPFSDLDPGDADNPPGPDGSDPQVFVDDLDDLMDVTYSPPRDGQGLAIAEMPGWSQTISMTWRDREDLTTAVPDGSSDMIFVQVEIAHNGTTVVTTGWLVARRESE